MDGGTAEARRSLGKFDDNSISLGALLGIDEVLGLERGQVMFFMRM